jgi:hypothetical protein
MPRSSCGGIAGFAPNINASGESCGKLEASGFAQNVLRQNQGRR